MKGLFEAEIFVDTVFSIESGAGNGNRFYLSEYATMHEFNIDCASRFSEEDDPEYVYREWSGIPDFLITRNWLCPNIFEIRDAIQMLDIQSIALFSEWCRNNGHDLRTDDPMMLVTRYQDYIRPMYEPDPENSEQDNDACSGVPYNLSSLGLGYGSIEIFGENYN